MFTPSTVLIIYLIEGEKQQGMKTEQGSFTYSKYMAHEK